VDRWPRGRRTRNAQNGSSPGKSHIYGSAMASSVVDVPRTWIITVMGAPAGIARAGVRMVGFWTRGKVNFTVEQRAT